MNEVTALAEPQLNTVASSSGALILDAASMDSMYRMAEIMAIGRSTVPEHLRGNKGDCMAVVMQSIQWKMNPFAVAQKTHVVNGALGYEAQLVNAVIQSSGVTEDRFHYEWYGPWEKIIGKTKVIKMPAKEGKKEYEFRVPDYSMADEAGLGVRVWSTLKGEAEPRVMDLLLVQASVRNSPLWATDPKQQLAYLAVKRWARLYSPDVILGVYSPDEFEQNTPAPAQSRDMGSAQVVKQEVPQALMDQAAAAARAGVASYGKFWADAGKANRQLLAGSHEEFKAVAERADSDRTIDQSATTAPEQRSPEMDALAADIDAVADEGIEAFDQAWGGLSQATQSALAADYPAMRARAEAVEAAK